jgi:SAM-dependent methyltransferase
MGDDLEKPASGVSFNWHDRFLQQARWTIAIRQSLYQRANLASARRVIEIGSGTGVLTGELVGYTRAVSFGLEIDPDRLQQAKKFDPRTRFIAGDAYHTPFSSQQFDLAFCHYFLLWASQPVDAIREMRRLTRHGGSVLALAEPDYGGRIDYPTPLEQIGLMQIESLRRQGADPYIGRKLADFFHQAGLIQVETGVLGGLWTQTEDVASLQSEWDTLAQDLQLTGETVDLPFLKAMDIDARQSGKRILFVPTFYAWGIVPD